MNNHKKSLFLTLGIIIVLTVSIIMSVTSAYNYIHTKNQIIEDMKKSSRATIISLNNNITNLIASYSINEYNNLILNEIKRRDVFAIVVEDYNMGKILGIKAYISGKIKDSTSNIIDYDFSNKNQNNQLQNSFYSDTYSIKTALGKKIGNISIYISDETMNKELNKIIRETILTTIIISFLLILFLFITIRLFIIKPILDMTEIITFCDAEGVPINSIPDNGSIEISALSKTINNMIKSIRDSRKILKENEDKLFQALKLQTTIFDNSGYLIIRTDKNGIIKQINKEAEKLLGYSSNELVDIHTPELIHLESECILRAENFSKELNQHIVPGFEVFVAKSNLGQENEHEWTYITKEGIHVPVLLSVSALRDQNNKIYGYLGIAKDVTQRKLLESQSKLASMGEMIGNIAHQWRQPLSVISTISSGIKVKSEFGQLDLDTLLPEMDIITEQTKYLSSTIDDFRNFIKTTNKKSDISILHMVEKALSILHSSIVNNNITLIANLKEDTTINGFENQLIQAIINIVNNAKDAMTEQIKTDNKFIFIETKKIKNDLILSIKDNAGGIKEEIMNKIFEPYFTTKHKSIGTGIGLSMAYQIIVEHHHATITVSNETYSHNGDTYTGACFQITFKNQPKEND